MNPFLENDQGAHAAASSSSRQKWRLSARQEAAAGWLCGQVRVLFYARLRAAAAAARVGDSTPSPSQPGGRRGGAVRARPRHAKGCVRCSLASTAPPSFLPTIQCLLLQQHLPPAQVWPFLFSSRNNSTIPRSSFGLIKQDLRCYLSLASLQLWLCQALEQAHSLVDSITTHTT